LRDYTLESAEQIEGDKSGTNARRGFLRPLKKLESVVLRQVDIVSHNLAPLMELPMLSHIYMDNKKQYQPSLGALTKLVESRD
jgi:hypothetical protein